MEPRSLAMWRLWMGGRDDPSFRVAQLQTHGSIAEGICLDERGGVRGGQRREEVQVADTCLSKDEPAFLTRESGLAVGTGPRQIWQGRWQGPGCTLGATLQSNTNKTSAPLPGPAVRPTAGSWEASVSVHWKLPWLLNNANYRCMDGPPKHKHRKSNATWAVLVAKASENWNPEDKGALSCVLDPFIMSASLGTLIFLSPIPKQTHPNCYQLAVEAVWAERRW